MLDLFFETSWEVCNKVGGIYAVLSTKARTLHKLYKDKVIFIGPDVWTPENESPYFIQSKTLFKPWLRQARLPMPVRVGRWNVPGKPIVVLVDFKPLFERKNDLYARMWEKYGVDSLHAYGDYDEACAFGYAAALVIESLVSYHADAKRVVAHFDEWTTGMGLLHVKATLPHVATVFTTHATSIGRSICGNGKPLYDYLTAYNGDQMAIELNMQSKHSLEKAAAHAADAFTTVSEVTARECEQLLERRPLVTPNAFERTFVPQGTHFAQARQAARNRLLQVASRLTGKQLAPDTLFVATSGRCEFRNKGIDLYLDSLNVLRTMLANGASKRQVVAFVLVPAWAKGPRADLRHAIITDKKSLQRLPEPYITHDLYDPAGDVIATKIRQLNFNNAANERVNVVYVPSYLNGSDGIFNMAYYDLLIGLDVTVFPSYYEPWGYTPHESTAFSVPTITTDLSGFGQWVKLTYPDQSIGIMVEHRDDSNYSAAVHAIARDLQEFYEFDDKRVGKLRRAAKAVAHQALWENYIAYYQKAYQEALDNCKKSNKK